MERFVPSQELLSMTPGELNAYLASLTEFIPAHTPEKFKGASEKWKELAVVGLAAQAVSTGRTTYSSNGGNLRKELIGHLGDVVSCALITDSCKRQAVSTFALNYDIGDLPPRFRFDKFLADLNSGNGGIFDERTASFMERRAYDTLLSWHWLIIDSEIAIPETGPASAFQPFLIRWRREFMQRYHCEP